MNATLQLSPHEMELFIKFKAQLQSEERHDREMRNVWNRVKVKFEDEFSKFDWSELRGKMQYELKHSESRKVQESIGQLIRATLKAQSTRDIPPADEETVVAITEHLLSYLLSFRDEGDRREVS